MFDYRFHIGTIAWLFHRISGLALIFYLSLHVWVVHYIAVSPETFNTLMAIMSSPIFKLAEVALLAGVLYHALNGIRLILVEFLWANKLQKELFYATFAVSGLLTMVGFYYLVLAHYL